MQLPDKGRDWDSLRADLVERGSKDAKWRDGKTAVYVFNAGEDVATIQKEAYTAYMSENGLGPAAFPSLAQMEKDVISMALGLLHGPKGATGAMTSGGTDSITMAIKTARDFARASGKAQDKANVVLPQSAHLAFDKACHLMDVDVRRIALKTDGSYEADVAAMEEACDADTIMIVGSAPNFPHGIIDPIAELGEAAERKGLWLHVDACVGGYFAPFARMNGVAVPPFDFEIPTVHSMSADLHKYGYAAKGASTVLFRSDALYQHMPFDFACWSGAPMMTPTLAGTRPGGAISAAWAVMNYLGVDGYCRLQGEVCATRERVEAGVSKLGFKILGKPLLGLVAFHHPDHHAFAIYGEMYRRGWFTSATVEPPSLHLMLSPKHSEFIDDYLEDLADSVCTVAAGEGAKAAEKAEVRYS
ncbi:aspartate aminotransferase family protein [Parasphingopyxis sp. CP4]|uniref:pyridoxal phosphate-dependent decarboxylase family protein n=1 Tax=Parasphingopyxis sp. CP4 TaxID=2724527 RepID=UPI0015A238DF|nr:aspartate aminotransferase family protein [Parasphingopyxis sp. CP4]QLC21303.1 aspartate aminotransferase family protein [Parasphingopyxis sp. CP4]